MSESDIKTLEKKINSDLRKAQNNMFSGKNEEAWAMMEEIWIDIGKIQMLDPNYRNLNSLEQKHNLLKQNLEKKLGKVTQISTKQEIKTSVPSRLIPSSNVIVKPEETHDSIEDKLPSAVTKRLQDIERSLSQLENYLDSDQGDSNSIINNSRYSLKSATGIFAELERMYSDHLDHPDVKVLQERKRKLSEKLEALTKQVQAAIEQAEKEKEQLERKSQEWVEKIRPYLLSGGVKEKQLELSRMRDKDTLISQKELIRETKQLYNDLQLEDWSRGKTWDIEESEKALLRMITNGEEAYNLSIKTPMDEALTLIEQKLDWFANDNEWRKDTSLRPNWLYQRDKDSITEKINQVYELVPEIISTSNPDLNNIKNKLEQLERENRERLTILPTRTFMVPDKYRGENAEDLKKKARDLVKEKESDAEILKVHLIREDWRVEDVIEHTDTSRTEIQHRITYHLPAQVAAQIGAKILLYNAHIAKNKQPDGTFNSLYGNLEDYPQTIALQNLKK